MQQIEELNIQGHALAGRNSASESSIRETENRISKSENDLSRVLSHPELINDGMVFTLPIIVCLSAMFVVGTSLGGLLLLVLFDKWMAYALAVPIGWSLYAVFCGSSCRIVRRSSDLLCTGGRLSPTTRH